MNAQRTSSYLLISLMLISLHSPLIQAEWYSENGGEESNSLFSQHTPIIDSMSENLQWSFARLQAPLEDSGYSEVPSEWIVVTDQVTKISEQMKHGKMVQDRFLDHVYTVPGSSISLENLNFLQENGEIELFAPSEDSLQPTPMTIPDDPLIPDQWHLINTGQDGNSMGVDLNVTAAWDRYNGSGVMIRIVDDGLDILHEDLQPNFDASTSYDYCDNDEDPSPVAPGDNHGTAVAGVAAGMGDNGIGIAGVAWGASHNHARFLCGGAAVPALSDFNQDIDIYHNSWGYSGAGFASLGPSSAAMLESGVYDGRSSLGSIFTFSAGNEYTTDENVNQKGFQKSRYTIAIGAITYSGVQSWYSSIGAPVLVVGPSNGGSLGITTADRTGSVGYSSTNYTNSFGGTSSSGPKVAGLAGLILEAEPTLTWRDMQAILVHSSTPNDLNHENWSVNGAGLPVSHYYGFGMVDATAAVNLAENWTFLGPEVNISTPLYTPSVNIPPSGTPLSFSHTVTDLLNIESVELFMDVDHQNPEDLIITLTSPSGYTSVLADTNPAEYGNMRYHDMVSMHHYGELTAGTWTVNVLDVNSTGSTGTVNDWQLVFHGTEADADGDGWTNEEENLCGSMVNDPNSTPDDVDGDGTCDAMDDDIDGDGWSNVSEMACGTDAYDPLSLPSADTDSDGLCDSVDIDDDNDGIEDNMDAFPLDGQAWHDTDGDGLADETYKLVCCTYSLDEFEDIQLNSTFSWNLGAPPSWSLDNSSSSSGNASLRSGGISDNEASSISMTLFTESATGSFAYKVDSESDYDFLMFSVDGAQVESWSGDTGWTNYSFPLSAGPHTLQWTYSKDQSVSTGQDAAWIDNLNLPIDLFMTNPEVTDYGTHRDHDDDGDGVDDLSDEFPLDGSETADFDQDGIGDNADIDDDGDGWFDIMEIQCGFDPLNSTSIPSDNDADGVCDSIDPDDDNDGYADQFDEFPMNATEWADFDGDGTGDNADFDDDDDGVLDEDDAFPLDPSETLDTDSDGLGNNADTDDDGDGVLDVSDAFPMNATEWADFDGDGTGDNADTDDDDDGVLDESDAFPLDPSETLDTDSDGIGNNVDTDDDSDGVLDESDAFPLDPSETLDTDSDGIGNNVDTDDDSDGVPDESDAFPLSPAESVDTDGDGLGNNADTDDDGDGVLDESDAFPVNATEWADFDGDGTGDNADTDDDDDSVPDESDAFPLDAGDWADFDGDGIGDNTDTDDDGDDVQDAVDNCPDTLATMSQTDTAGCSAEQRDTDDDGLNDFLDDDDDGDGWTDLDESVCDSDPLLVTDKPIDSDADLTCDILDEDDDNDGISDQLDVFPLDPSESIDTDGDLIGDNSDTDDDNDGVLDVNDAYPLDETRTYDERILIGAAAIGAALIAALGVASVLGVKKRKIKPDNTDIQMMLQALER
jgi:subtilisin-like proprotein convertase family protein